MSDLSVRISEIRSRLNAFIEGSNKKYSNNTIAKGIDRSTSLVSQFRRNIFPSPATELEFAERVDSCLNTLMATHETNHELKFALTKSAKDIFKLIGYVHRAGEIGLIIGDNGLGKTKALKEHIDINPNNILIQVTSNITPKSLLEDICSAVSIPTETTRDTMFKQIVKKLSGTYRDLYIDEGEHLSVPCLDNIRRIHDFTKIGLILSGSKKLLDKLNRKRSNLQYLNSRIGVSLEIDSLDIEDVTAILKINFPEALRYSRNFLQLSKNNGRFLEKIIKLVKDKINETRAELNEDLIDEAADRLVI